MYRKHAIRAGVATVGMGAALATVPLATAATPRASAAAAAKVTVSVKGKSKTLLAPKTVKVPSGWVTRGGAGSGKCPGDSAQGALNVATHGHWQGKWYASYKEYFITGVLGDRETTKKYYWGLYVNGKASSKGACLVKLKAGDKVEFKVTKS